MMFRRLLILMLILLAGTLTARGQELRTAVPLDDGTFLAAGECLAWLDAEGNVLRKRPLSRPLTVLANYKKRLYALDTEGHLLRLDKNGNVLSQKMLPVQGRLRGLTVFRDLIWIVTDAGEILHGDGVSGWTVQAFNEVYAGYYPRMDFRAVAGGSENIMVAGIRPDGKPTVFTSARGTVWNERSLDYMERGLPHMFTDTVTGLGHDAAQDRFYLTGGGGALLALPGCSHCNTLTRYPVDTLYARIPVETGTLLLGSGGYRKIEDK